MLVVDDDDDQARTMKRLLEKKFEAGIDTASDLSLARVAMASKDYDVVVLDYQLPDGSGLDLLGEITSKPAHPQVIMVTGQGGEDVAAEAFRLRASGYVVKDSRLPAMIPEIVSRSLNEVSLRRAEESLHANEEAQRALLDATPETLMLLDNKGIILTINEMGARRLGSTPLYMVGTDLADYLPPEIADLGRRQFAVVARTFEPVNFEYEREGTRLSNVIFPVFGREGRVDRVALFSQDVTARKAAEEALRQAHEELEERVLERTAQLRKANDELRKEIEERRRAQESLTQLSSRVQEQARILDQILSSSPQQFYLFDSKGKFIYASKPAAEMLGHQPGDFSGKYWWELGFPEDAMREVDIQRENVLRSGDVWVGQLKFPTPGGVRDFEYILSPIVRADGTVDTVVATARDVTEEKRAQAELVTRTARLQEQVQLLDLTHETVLVRDVAGRIVFWNAGAEEMFGWKREEALGKDAHELLKTEFSVDLEEIEDILAQEGHWEGELIQTAKDGSKLTVASRQVVKWRDINMPESFLEIDYDITERKELESELEERIAMLEDKAHLLDLIPKPLIVTDMNNKISLWSSAAVEAFGWTQDEALGKVAHELLKADFGRPLADIEFELVDSGSWEGEIAYTSKGGEKVRGRSRWVLRWDDDGAPQSIIELIC